MGLLDVALLRTLIVTVFSGFLGVWIKNRWENRPRLIAFQWHAVGVAVPGAEGQQAGIVNVHSIIVRNAGRKTATHVRLGHANVQFNYTVWPLGLHTERQLATGGREIEIERLVPKQEVMVTYLYNAPTLAQHINTHIQDDAGDARILRVAPQPVPPRWLLWLSWFLIACGTVSVLYALVQLGRTYWPLFEVALAHK